jgi:hypothetical protein
MKMVPNCTLITSCFVLTKYNPSSRSIQETLKNIETLLYIPVFLVIYCDSSVIDDIKKIRDKKGYSHLTQYIETDFENIWAYQYVDKVKENRAKYHPTRDSRTCAESHLLCCNKFDFLLKTMEENPFHTDRFGWIDSNIGVNASKIARNYHINMLPDVLNNITDKFKIQILNVADKKYKDPAMKMEFYNQYRWVVCGSLFTTGKEVGIPILKRLNEIFIESTEAGYGHAEEMFFLEVLDEFYDSIDKSYGDYHHILNNFIQPTSDLLYTYMHIVKRYYDFGYYRECYDCSHYMIEYLKTVKEKVDYATYMMILLCYYSSAKEYKPNEVPRISNHITYLVSNYSEFAEEFNRYRYLHGINGFESAKIF